MFFQFFDELRSAKVPVTLKEYLALMDALSSDVIELKVDDPILESVRLRSALHGLGVPIDVVVLSRDEAARRAAVPGTLVERLELGVVKCRIYLRRPARIHFIQALGD